MHQRLNRHLGRISLVISALLALSCSTGNKTSTQAPVAVSGSSSEIPERREFPVNAQVSPCTDFYAYACSMVDSSFRLRDDRSAHDFAFNDSDERILTAKIEYLEGLGNATAGTIEPKDSRATALKNVYTACMDETDSAAEEKQMVHKILSEVKALKTREALQQYLGDHIFSADDGFLDFDVVPNLADPNYDDLILLGNLQGLPERSYYDKPEVVEAYRSIMAQFFDQLGEENGKKRAEDVFKLEKEFAQSYPLPAEFRELINKKTEISRDSLKQRYSHLRLKTFLNAVPSRTHIRNLAPKNFAFLDRVLDVYPIQVIKDIYLAHELPGYMDDAYPEFFKARFEFNHKYLGGPPVRRARKERCTKMVMDSFPKEIDAELLPKLFPDFPSERVVAIAEKIRGTILMGLQDNKWLSPDGRKEAMKKLKVAKLQLVKPATDAEWDFNPPADYSSTAQYKNARILKFNLEKKRISELARPRDRSRWGFGPLTVNAYYSPPDNKFVLPIGILQYPFFDASLPDEANLGAVGAVIGHELGHSIDDKGSRYDESGKLHEWMTAHDLMEFKKRGQVLVEQFNQDGENGELTLGENIGDFVGLTFSYRAAFPDNKADIEGKKAFFLQYGRLWCNVMRPKYKEMMLKINPHSLGELRVNQQLKNQPGFIESYSCKAGDEMYLPPEKRAQVW